MARSPAIIRQFSLQALSKPGCLLILGWLVFTTGTNSVVAPKLFECPSWSKLRKCHDGIATSYGITERYEGISLGASYLALHSGNLSRNYNCREVLLYKRACVVPK